MINTRDDLIGEGNPIKTVPRNNTPILLYLAVPSKQAVGSGAAPEV